MKKISSIMCRLGRKRKIQDLILQIIPKSFTTYIEPFIGSGDIYLFLNLDESTKAVINDLDPLISESWKLIKSNPSVDGVHRYDKLSDAEKNKYVFNTTHTNPLDKLVKNIARLCGSFSGLVRNSDKKLYNYYKVQSKLNKIDSISKYMKNTTVLNQDYKTVIKKYDNANAFIYLDPPYENPNSKLYREEDMDYEEMARFLKNIKGKFLLSINDSPNIRNIFKDFNIKKITVDGAANKGSSLKTIGVKQRAELLITNY